MTRLLCCCSCCCCRCFAGGACSLLLCICYCCCCWSSARVHSSTTRGVLPCSDCICADLPCRCCLCFAGGSCSFLLCLSRLLGLLTSRALLLLFVILLLQQPCEGSRQTLSVLVTQAVCQALPKLQR
jgi:hypothetical protein